MEQKDKQRLFTLLYIALIVCAIGFMIFMVFWLKSESAMCMKDPINFFANKTSQMCYCNDGLGWFNPKGVP